MTVGAGAMMHIAREMARVQRQLDRHLEKRRAWRDARFRRGVGVILMPNPSFRADFPCFSMCSDCGYLVRKPEGSCPACDNTLWLDLGDTGIADTLRDGEEKERNRSPLAVKLGLGAGVVGAVGAVAAGTSFGLLPVGIAVAAAVPSYALLLRPVTVALMRLSRKRPIRWHMPLPLPGSRAKPDAEATGELSATGDALVSPLSGRRCLAYQISVLFDAKGDSRPPEWVLQETSSAAARVGDLEVPAGRALVDKPVRLVDREEFEESGLDLTRFLRERGLFAYDGEYELFETTVEAGEPVKLSWFDEPRVAKIVAAG